MIRTRSGASSNLIGRNDNLLAVRVGDELWSGGDANLWHLVHSTSDLCCARSSLELGTIALGLAGSGKEID